MKLYLIRHGETDYNRQKLFYGKTDVSINKKGMKQAYLLKEKLVDLESATPVYTSSLKRTIETAELIFPNHPKFHLPELDEKDFGLWEGLTADQINQRYPVEWQRWLASPFEFTPTNAESFHDFETRILRCFKTLLQQNQDMVLVGHLGGIRTIQKFCFPKDNFWDIPLDQDSYTEVHLTNGTFTRIVSNK